MLRRPKEHLNWKLKLAVLRAGRPQYELARQLGWSESRFSRVIHGVVPVTEAERDRLASLLGMPASDLFADEPSAENAS